MALTKIEELSILAGTIKPPTVELSDLINQIAVAEAIDFMNNHKIFDVIDDNDPPLSINAKAAAYKDKLITVVTTGIESSIGGLDKIIVSILGASTVTSAQLSGANDAQWETFIENEMFRAFEIIAIVRRQEKIDYDALS